MTLFFALFATATVATAIAAQAGLDRKPVACVAWTAFTVLCWWLAATFGSYP